MRLKLHFAAAPLAIAFSLLSWQTSAAYAQPASGSDEKLEEITITGSHLRRTDTETPSPVEIITAEQLHESGYNSIQDVLHNLTANGQGTLSQSFSGAFASGASAIALRGLNVGATLVLINGHRAAPYPIGDDGQRSFVDVANLPFEAIERVEVLKDGASAVYGSDAIAGVVNIILKKSYQGASLTAEAGTSSHGDGNIYHLSGIWGTGDLDSDGHNVYLSAEYRRQEEIKFTDRGGTFTKRDYSSTGGVDYEYGAPNYLSGPTPTRSPTGFVLDSNTGDIVGFMAGCDATRLAAGQCTYKDTWDQIQPPTENINLAGRFTQKLSEDWTIDFDGSFFQSKAEQVNDPDRAFYGGYQGISVGPGIIPSLLPAIGPTTISSSNPSYPVGATAPSGDLRYTFLNLGPTITRTNAKTYRAVVDLEGKLATWNVEASLGYSEVRVGVIGLNYVDAYNLQTALDSTTDPFLVGQPNSAALNNFVAPRLSTTDTSKLTFAHLGASRDLMQLGGGALGLAVGTDYYTRKQYAVAPPEVQSGVQATGRFSNNFTTGKQNVASAYVELGAPVLKQLELDAALRYDHYNLSGGKASPKAGFKFTPIPQFAIRGTASKGFRAPDPAENGDSGQAFFAGTTSDPVLCPDPSDNTAPGNFIGQCDRSDLPGLQSTNPKLKPETSTAFTLGFIFEPVPEFTATVDFYSIEIDDQIVSGGPTSSVRGTNFSPLQQYVAGGGTVTVVPPVAPFAYTTVSYINANTTKTNGVDLTLEYRHQFSSLNYRSQATWSYTNKYDLTIDGTTYSLAGTHGPFYYSGDTGNPKSRIQWSNTIGREAWQITGTLNYISSFSVTDPSSIAFVGAPQDTCLDALIVSGGAASTYYANQLDNGVIPSDVSCTVGSYITFDLYGRYDIGKHLDIHGSVLNLFNEEAPLDWVTYGGALGYAPWNPSLHQQGAIGPFFTLGVTYKF